MTAPIDDKPKETVVAEEPDVVEEPKVVEEKPPEPVVQAKVEEKTEEKVDASDVEQVVVFKLAGEEYASPILEVQEIITTGDITPFPNVPEYISGIINVRGTVATIINLSKRFNLKRSVTEGIDGYIILTNKGKALFGIMVDEVTSVMKIPKNSMKAATSVKEGVVKSDYIREVAVVNDRVILIIDFQKILDEETIINVADQAAAEAK